jgi:Zn finger protein HypA/HybF involved in hydrogenase expression
MHDFHLADEIVKIARKETGKSGLSKIEKILIE